MGTRGFVGFVVDSTEKIGYVHWDAYPGGLGLDTLTWLRSAIEDMDALRSGVAALRVVGREDEPTAEDIERLRPFTNLSVGDQSEQSWYNLLRETQGNPAAILKAGVVEDASEFPVDSLFAEWGFIVDLDGGTFEAFKGFQREPHNKGRFAARTGRDDYHPVALAGSWPLDKLPDNDAFMNLLDPDGDE